MIGLAGAQSAPLAVFSVTTTADSGAGSLRQAIADSNASVGVADTITFSITGPGPHTITLGSALPAISDPVTIDGTTEPDFGTTPVVEIDGTFVGSGNDVLRISAGNTTVRGLVINRVPFGGAAIQLLGNGGNVVAGNYIGTNVAGTARAGNSRGIWLSSSPNVVGGDTSAERNVISGSTLENIRVDASGNTIQGNYIGIDATGTVSLALPESPNSNGIFINGDNDTIIGGTTFGQGNLISGNGGNGIFVSGSGNIIRGNLIGTNAAGTAAVCNGTTGIAIGSASTSNIIGGIDSGARNVISGNCGSGISLSGSGSVALGNTIEANFIGTDITGTSAVPNAGAGIKIDDAGVGEGTRNTVVGGIGTASANVIAMNGGAGVEVAGSASRLNRIRSNSIFENGGLGIDLGAIGVTANDPPASLDADTGANDLQNFPVLNPDISSATEVAGDLDSAAGQTYAIDVYSSPTCDGSTSGEGKTRVASFDVTTNASGHADWGERPLSPTASGFLTATATHTASGNTSEFSSCLELAAGGGDGTLEGSLSASGGNVDLTAVGTQDWAIWGYAAAGTSTSLSPDVRKDVGSVISSLGDIHPTNVPHRGLGQFPFPENPFTFEWSDGSEVPEETEALGGLQHNGQQSPPPPPGGVGSLNDGFSFTVPADTTSRTLRVYVSAHSATGRLTATLSDDSAPPYVNSALTGPLNGANVPGVYTIDYSAAAADETLTVEWIESVRPNPDFDFGADNVPIYAVALDGPGGGGGDTDAPVLFAAVPDANAVNSTGVAGLVEQDGLPAGTDFEIQFYVGETCEDSSPGELDELGDARTVMTNANGVAAFALDGLPDIGVGTAVWARARLSEAEPFSDLSNCVIADRNNTSWPTALPMGATSSETGHIRTTGQARWFKVPVLANSRVNVTLAGLPADYDLVVFGDIQAAYNRITKGAPPQNGPNLALDDLERDGAETPVDVFNTSQYNPSTWDATNWDATLNNAIFSPSEWSPSEWSPSEWSASIFSPSEWSPSEWSPSEWSPSEWSPSEWSPSEWSPSQWSPSEWSNSNPADRRTFSSAQTASLLAVSSTPGTGDETVSVNTWNNTGSFYIRVQGKNGSFDEDSPFTLNVEREGSLCSGVADIAGPAPSATSGIRTLILVDRARLPLPAGGPLDTRLATFRDRPEVDGAIVDVNADATVRALNVQADAPANRSCPFAKNLVATRVKRIVDVHRAANPNLQYVVVVGGDGVIPFFRFPDPALLGNETLYKPPVGDNTASQASLRLGYLLSDDFIVSRDGVSRPGKVFPVPDLAIGRLVEQPDDILGMLDAYLATAGGVVPTPTSSLTTGYDFLQDSADVIAAHFQQGIGGSNNEQLITSQAISPGVTTVGNTPDRNHSWTATDLRRELLTESNDLVFLAGHFSANDALAADYRTNVLSTELPSSSADLVNSIVFSAGCHAGYNIVNGDATPFTEPLDWAQAFARKRATLIAGTGYQYGDTDFVAHSERIYTEFGRQLRLHTGASEPIAVGGALLRSKQKFLESTPGLSSLDEKSLLQTTLFGLPMLSVDFPNGRILDTPEASVIPGTIPPVGPGPGADLGLRAFDHTVAPALAPDNKQLKDGPLATWLSGPNGVAVKPTQPILPLESVNVTPSQQVALRGVGFRGGTYRDTPGVTPLTGAPATELRGIHAPFATEVFFPPRPWTPSYFDTLGSGAGRTQLHVTPVQHRSESPTMTRRTFEDLDVRLFYSGNVTSYCPGTLNPAPCPGSVVIPAVTPALSAPPTIAGVDVSVNGTTLTFEAHVIGDLAAGVQAVWVTWTIPPAAGNEGTWASVDLTQNAGDPTLWTGRLMDVSSPAAVDFMVQAVNGVGKVTIDDNVGAYYRSNSIPGPPDPNAPPPAATSLTFTAPPPSTVEYGDTFSVTARLTSGGDPVSGKLVRIGLGGSGPPQQTVNGQVTATVRAALTPNQYLLTASFAGDATHAASDATAIVNVIAQPTSLVLSGTLGARTTGSPLSIVATLKDTNSPQAPLHQRTVFLVFTGTGGTSGTRGFQSKTDPQGRAEFTSSTLASLPTGSYNVRAYFNGVAPLGIGPDDVDYGHSESATQAFSLARGIVFASTRTGLGDIYAVDPAGTSPPIQITSGNAIDAEPEWSPGADKVVFSSTRAGNVELFVMDRDGSDITRLTTDSAIDTSPTWSPNGQKIAFASNRGGNWDIYMMNADGTGTTTRLTTNSNEDLLPAWSPNSLEIAFMSNRSGDGDIYTLTVSNPSTTQVRRTNSSSVDSEPAWSGSTVAFSTNRHGSSNFELYTMTFPTPTGLGTQTRRTNQNGHDITPAWSPDGSKLAFASNRSPGGGLNFNIYTMNANGTGSAQSVVIHSAADIFPDW